MSGWLYSALLLHVYMQEEISSQKPFCNIVKLLQCRRNHYLNSQSVKKYIKFVWLNVTLTNLYIIYKYLNNLKPRQKAIYFSIHLHIAHVDDIITKNDYHVNVIAKHCKELNNIWNLKTHIDFLYFEINTRT